MKVLSIMIVILLVPFLVRGESLSRRNYGPGLWSVGDVVVMEEIDGEGNRVIHAWSIVWSKIRRSERILIEDSDGDRESYKRYDYYTDDRPYGEMDFDELVYELADLRGDNEWMMGNSGETFECEDQGVTLCIHLYRRGECETIRSYIRWASQQPGLYSLSGELVTYKNCIGRDGKEDWEELLKTLEEWEWGNPQAKERTFKYNWD